MRLLLLLLLLAGCAAAPPPEVACEPGGVRVRAEGLRRVEVWSEGGRIARRGLEAGDELFVAVDAAPGAELELRVRSRSEAKEQVLRCVAVGSEALRIEVAAPAGQALRPLGGALTFSAWEGAELELALVLTSREARRLRLEVGAEVLELDLPAGGRKILTRPLDSRGPTTLRAEDGVRSWEAVLQPRPVAVGAVALAVESVVFPADAGGAVDVARPRGRVTLPGRAWSALLERTGLGLRGQDREVPWAFHQVTLRNDGAEPLDVMLRSRVQADGAPAEAFRPVVRDADGGTGITAALVRVPAGGRASAALPLFIDETRLPEGASAYEHVLDVLPLGLAVPLIEERSPLAVSRGSSWVALGFALALLAACLGVGSAMLSVPGWLRSFRTSDLTMIAVFATLGFVVTAATAVLASGVAAVLGPFSMLVTGLVSDCLRSALLATLIVLLPRRGAATLYLLLGWLMQGIALGAFSPTDFVFVGGRIFWLESFLWLAGLTRGGGWRDEGGLARFGRLSVGLAGSSLLSMAGSLASQIVLFRLYYAGWFVLLMLALPGVLYDVLACALATSFAASLRRVRT